MKKTKPTPEEDDPELAEMRAALRAKRKKSTSDAEDAKVWLSTGSTLLNLACTGNPFRGMMAGGYYLVIGDSSAGKTVLASTCLAEAAINPKFDDYDLIFDNVEDGAFFFEKFYGPRVCKRIKSPNTNKKTGEPANSTTVEEFYANHSRLTSERSNIYILDSQDALSSDAEKKKQKEKRKAIETQTETAGVMTDAKAKLHSQNLRAAVADTRDTKSILVMLAQSRDNMGFGAQFEPKTRSGGRALKFYAQLEMWFSVLKHLKKDVRGKQREIGIVARVKVKKNRFTGKNRTVDIPIYHSFGIDDIGSCIEFLITEKHWSKKKGAGINAPEFEFTGSTKQLIDHIEQNNLERQLRKLVGRVWHEIEAETEVVRKNKYL